MNSNLLLTSGLFILAFVWIIFQIKEKWMLFIPGALLLLLGLNIINEGVSFVTDYNKTIDFSTNTTRTTEIYTQTKTTDTKLLGWWTFGIGLILLASPAYVYED